MRSETKRMAYVEAIVSMVLNTILFVLKIWAGLVTGSIAIIADAWHTLSDSFTSLVVLLGARASAMPADSDHPFGHGTPGCQFSDGCLLSPLNPVLALLVTPYE